ncbi:hypothetical protein BCU68_09250 [Vibrio sp. 10N.286.49.B3]|uniref:capsule biosynthesis GfcC family protein n=1 Tax=Vibrio sp. 10N.286.49.B3 TaxID=1880855 RepID=UPI000C8526C0|nr:capsule biosynthesis GfcC family protein [Vibrio sp. 10N.286.49.B3]PMH45970.1 hypothetical protein BCU68_09250 [Vibrio sp. 10N.286.49.B3]
MVMLFSFFATLLLSFVSVAQANVQPSSQINSQTTSSQPALTVDVTPAALVQLQYPQAVRLDQVMSDGLLHHQQALQASSHRPYAPYSLANKLFDNHKQAQTDRLYHQVIDQLALLARYEIIDKNKTITANSKRQMAGIIIEQLKAHRYGYRELISLDFDLIRLDEQHNPQLQGSYELQLAQRPTQIQVYGNVHQVAKIDFVASRSITDYLALVSPLEAPGNNSNVWLIFPDGNIEKSGYAYWNDQHATLAPGTMIFWGFNRDWFANPADIDLDELESNIATLLTMVRG